jgi:hypothetical protein
VTSLLFISIGILLAWGTIVRLPLGTRATTLLPASNWTLAASALWTLTWSLNHLTNSVSQSVADHLWYACAIIALCPPIAVLGSRRPGTRVWTAFILVPMLFALGWPVITLWLQGSDVRGLQLETPQLVGYLLVLVMGTGNYIGTRFTLAALLYAIANAIVVVSSSQACPAWLSDRWWVRLFATAGMVVAVLSAGREAAFTSHLAPGFDKLWLDFFDQFGIVWGRRIQDRVNFIAVKEKWPAKLQLNGFQWNGVPDPATEARIEHTFRWLLRRFVDPDWIDERIGQPSPTQDISPLSADS